MNPAETANPSGMLALENYLFMADTDKKRILRDQWSEAVAAGSIHCTCGLQRALPLAFRCLYCGQWYCGRCAEQHFGQTIREWIEAKRVAQRVAHQRKMDSIAGTERMSQNPPKTVMDVPSPDLLGWLRGKLADAEQSLKGREALANPPTISEEEWEKLKSLPGTIVGKSRKPSKAKMEERRLELLRHKRIAVKCRHEVQMFRAVIAALSPPNP